MTGYRRMPVVHPESSNNSYSMAYLGWERNSSSKFLIASEVGPSNKHPEVPRYSRTSLRQMNIN